MASPPPPKLFIFVIVASILVAAIGWYELHRSDHVPDQERTDGSDERDRAGRESPGGEPGTDLDRPQPRADGAATPTPTLPALVGADGEVVLDPGLVPGRPGVGVPEGHGEVDPDVDDDWADRNRNPSEYPPPSVVPPAVADREPGQPPSPQGAGARAHEVWSGEADAADAPVDPDAVRAELQAAVQRQRIALSRCFATGQLPALAVTVQPIRREEGRVGGYVSTIDGADGSGLSEEVEDCLMQVLEDLALSAPAGAGSATVVVGS